jgi:signal peptidase II
MQAARGASLSEPERSESYPASGRPRLTLLLAVAGAVLTLDVVTKHLAVDRLSESDPVEVVDGILQLRLVRNAGAAFGFASGLTVVLSVVATVVVLVILRAARRLRSAGWAVGLALVLGGAMGNLLDRIFRDPAPLRGHVIDFMELPHWPVFNVADSAIMSGGVLLVLLSMRGIEYDGTRAGAADPSADPSTDPSANPSANPSTNTD